MPSNERGMTLLEVLAAVAILGILYTALATAATRGIHNEANTRRRLEASLLADQALSAVELQIAEQATPPIGKTQSELGDYRVEVSVDTLPLPPALVELRGTPDPTAPSLLGGTDQSENLLRRIEVEVIWADGAFEQQVGRVTYAYDVPAAQAITGPPSSAGAKSGLPGAAGEGVTPPAGGSAGTPPTGSRGRPSPAAQGGSSNMPSKMPSLPSMFGGK
jgi:prepilin-type N-terminal cleavage/methylation domain-containing protein